MHIFKSFPAAGWVCPRYENTFEAESHKFQGDKEKRNARNEETRKKKKKSSGERFSIFTLRCYFLHLDFVQLLHSTNPASESKFPNESYTVRSATRVTQRRAGFRIRTLNRKHRRGHHREPNRESTLDLKRNQVYFSRFQI